MPVDADEELMLRVSQGEWGALELLLGRYEGPLLAFFHRLGCDPGACEDLVQTVMIRLYDERRRYDPHRPFAPWLYGIARNVRREHVRQRARARVEPLDESGDAAVEAAAGPLEQAEAGEESDLVRRALLRLPEEERLTLVLRHWQGLTYEEIAGALDVPLGTVKWRIHDAHRKLAAWLAAKDSGEVWG